MAPSFCCHFRRSLRRLPGRALWGLALAAASSAGGQDAPVAGITTAETAQRRSALAARLDSGVVVSFGGRNLVHDFSTFFQLPAFRYLTELNEPDAVLVMVVRGKRSASTLFLAPIEPRMALYYGARTEPATSMARTGLPGRPLAELGSVLDSLAGTGLPFYDIPDVETMDFAASDTLTRGQQAMKGLARRFPALTVRDGMRHVLALRARRSPAELALIRSAAAISSEGHRAAMLTAAPQHEFEVRAALEYEFTRRGAERPAYGSIVGAGINGTTLHYMKANAPVGPNDLVLVDAAAEYRGYAADITRTFPVSGRYTPEQRAIYQLVRDAQDVAERMSQAGMSVRTAADSTVAVRARGLARLGLIDSVEALIDPPWRVDCAANPAPCRQSYLWMIHGISHGIGLAVHDPLQGIGRDAAFQVGDAFTIEPGIYISTRALDMLPDTPRNRAFKARVRPVVQRYENTGVRIEDDYILTDKGLERISLVPREIDEIEALMARRRAIQP